MDNFQPPVHFPALLLTIEIIIGSLSCPVRTVVVVLIVEPYVIFFSNSKNKTSGTTGTVKNKKQLDSRLSVDLKTRL